MLTNIDIDGNVLLNEEEEFVSDELNFRQSSRRSILFVM